jgi:hypothetical protein
VAAFFNAEAYKYPNGYCYLTSYLDTVGTGPVLYPRVRATRADRQQGDRKDAGATPSAQQTTSV